MFCNKLHTVHCVTYSDPEELEEEDVVVPSVPRFWPFKQMILFAT